ncbi:MAG TPA: serine/threonine-protein kinase [Polyangiaceae bacterium]|nr:serine/threonine-protein kinase [Polyangiaceae bacterium]
MSAEALQPSAGFDAELGMSWELPQENTLIGGRFRIGRPIGEGGMSAVFKARDERLGRDVAFKLLSPRLAFSREVVTRFVNEARTLARLDCPRIVRVLDAGVTNGGDHAPLPYMVLELLHGEDLRAQCERGPVPSVRRVLGWILEACEGLAAAHAQGIVHRDLKPENLFLAREADGTEMIKVLDFGIARSLAMPSSLTFNGEGVGSPGYMSPEQLRDASAADERSDIWSLGVVLYELLAGVPPFRADSTFEVCTKISAGRVPRLRRPDGDLPRGLGAVVRRCLNVDPAERYADVAELAEALLPFCPDLAEPALYRIRRRLHTRPSGEVTTTHAADRVDVRAPTEPALWEDASAFHPAADRRRHLISRMVVGLSLAGMLALLAQAFGLERADATTLAQEARGVVTRTSERVSQAARDLW